MFLIKVNDIFFCDVMVSSVDCGEFSLIVFREVTRDYRDKQREDKQGCDRENCE